MIKVTYVDHMGSDLTVVNAARVSFGANKSELEDKDKKLINYLAKHKHMSPFEHCQLTVVIDCPLYIRSQIHRHRTFSYNEISRRYTDKDLEFFIPETFRKQHKSNRQASEGEVTDQLQTFFRLKLREHQKESRNLYERMIESGICKEQARGALSQDLMTHFYMSGNLRNWAHFVELRDHEGAQGEVQEVARAVKAIIKDKFPEAYNALETSKG